MAVQDDYSDIMGGGPLGPAEVLDEADVRALLGTFSRRAPTAVRNRALVLLLWRSGVRIAEALRLEVGDVRLDGVSPSLTVRDGKGHKQRVVGLHHEAAEALARWLDVRRRRGLGRRRLIFCTLHGGQLDQGYVRAMLRRKRQQAGITRRIHPHAFRATLAVDLAREGTPLPTIREVLGHTNVAHTDAYLRRVFPADAIEAVINRGGDDPAPAAAEALAPRQQLAHALDRLDDAAVERLLAALAA